MASEVASRVLDPESAESARDSLPNLDHDPSADPVSSRPGPPVTRSLWVRTCRDFLKCHRLPLNVALHLLTTPIGIFGLLALLHWLSPVVMASACLVYVVALACFVPGRVWLATTGVIAGLSAAVVFLAPGWLVGVVTLIVGYGGQDAAHWLLGERTLTSTYSSRPDRGLRFVEHSFLLLPLVLVTAGRWRQSPARLLVARKAVLKTKLTSDDQQRDLEQIRSWVGREHPDLSTSNHWWQSDLADESGAAFERLSHDASLMSMIGRFHGPGFEVRPVLGMNELYVTGPPKQSTSDTVFYMGHVDGPWAVFPGARLYRCMLAASPNRQVTTHFPMCGTAYHEPEGHRLESGDAVAFDFNRELHYITREADPEQNEPRVNLKLHFVAFPKSLTWYGKLLDHLTTRYDIRARNLFLATIDPNSWVQRIKTKWVLGWTKIFELMVRYVGWTNLAYLALAAVVSLVASDWRVFLVATSFVHYGIYVGTYAERGRGKVSFGEFRRDAVLFKTVAMLQLGGLYAFHFSGQWVSLALAVGGFALASYATWVLGVNRTYFSAELGFDEPKRIHRFPYGVIPHPMILGAAIGIASMLLVPAIRQNYPWLIGGHLFCYAVVLCQEWIAERSFDSPPSEPRVEG